MWISQSWTTTARHSGARLVVASQFMRSAIAVGVPEGAVGVWSEPSMLSARVATTVVLLAVPAATLGPLAGRQLRRALLATGDEPSGLLVEGGDGAGELLPGLLTLGVEALEVPDAPLAQQRRHDVVVVNAQVVDASHGHLH